MTYREIKKIIEGKELSIRSERDFEKLSENSSEKELERFVKRYSSLFSTKNPDQEDYEEYNTLQEVIKELSSELKITMEDALTGEADAIIKYNEHRFENPALIQAKKRAEELKPGHDRWLKWTGGSIIR